MEGVAEHAKDSSERCPIQCREIDFETMEEVWNNLQRAKSCYIPREYCKDGTVLFRER